MNEPLEPIPEDVADLLAAERRRPDVPQATADALYAAVLAAGPPPDGGGGGGGGGSGASASEPGGVTTIARAVLRSRPFIAAASLALGTLLGAMVGPRLHALEAPPPAVSVAPSAPTPATTDTVGGLLPIVLPPAPSDSSASLVPHQTREAAPKPPRLTAPATSAVARGSATASTLGAERVLLEVARSALARGDGRAALEALTAHEERHPRGQLAEEREAMVVQALASAGRRNEAVARAARFRLAYPTSVLLPIVDAAVR